MIMAGCGGGSNGSSPPAAPPDAGNAFTLGPLQVGTASGHGCETLTLNSPGTSRVAFTVLYGANIVRLAEVGYEKIAFMSDRDGKREIYVMNADGTGQINLTNNPATDEYPAWSPDGGKIAFQSDRDGNREIYVMNPDGTGQTNVSNNPATDGCAHWSPDGRKIGFQSDRDDNSEIYVMNADGSGQTRLTTDLGSHACPVWSPDGQKIAFFSDRDGNNEIYVMNADGTGETNLTSNWADERVPAWSPDGRKIAFYSSRDGRWEVYVMNTDGTGQTNLTNHPASDAVPAWSPDGRKIAFQSTRHGNYQVYVMNPDGSDVRQLTNNGAYDGWPAWCPAPSVSRTLIGPAGSDGGSDPPFGAERPLAVVGLTADGLVSATTIQAAAPQRPRIRVAALENIGTDLAGVKITAREINNVQEDMGRGLAPRVWDVSGTADTDAVLVFFSGETGRISSVIAVADTMSTAGGIGQELAVELISGRVVLRGLFVAAFTAADPHRDLASVEAREIVLDSGTGEVVSVN